MLAFKQNIFSRVLHNFFITVLIFLSITGASYMPLNFGFLNPLQKTFNDFEFNDIVFSQLRDHSNVALDTNIVLVNIGYLDHNEIVKRLSLLKEFEPKVIAIDVLFSESEDAQSDEKLVSVINSIPNCVLAGSLIRKNKKRYYDSIFVSKLPFRNYKTGFVNLITDENAGFQTVRTFSPQFFIKNKKVNSFSLEIVKLYNPDKYDEIIYRGNNEEVINYERNVTYNNYMRIDIDQLDSTIEKSIIRDKIILVGFLGQNFNDSLSLQDKFFTPMNAKYAGKSYPDMYGVVIHANIISMILNSNYINTMPVTVNILLSVFACLVNVCFLIWLFNKVNRWYSEISSLLLIVKIVSLLYLSTIIFNLFNFQFRLIYIISSIVLAPNLVSTYEEIKTKIKKMNHLKRRIPV